MATADKTTLETLLSDPGTAGVWNLVAERSALTFQTKNMWGRMTVDGRFTEVSGDARLICTGAVAGRLDIRAESLRTGIRKRDQHLRSADLFDVERFPEISVVVTALQPTTGNAGELRADISVKGRTHPLLVPVTVTALDDGAVRVSAKTMLDRAQFGLGWNRLGMIGATTTVSADVVLVRTPQ